LHGFNDIDDKKEAGRHFLSGRKMTSGIGRSAGAQDARVKKFVPDSRSAMRV
jgi:hypothetical protein